MAGIMAMARQFFVEDDWKFQEIEGADTLRMGFNGHNGTWTCYAQAREADEQFVFYSVIPALVPEAKRPAMAEFLHRANYGLRIGNFEIDYSDGEIRYKTSIDVEGDRLTPQLVKMLVYANLTTCDRYFGGIMKVLYTETAPFDAIQEIENPPADG